MSDLSRRPGRLGQGTLAMAQRVPHDRVQAGISCWLAAHRRGQNGGDPMQAITSLGDGRPLTGEAHHPALHATQRWLARHPFPVLRRAWAHTAEVPLDPAGWPTLRALRGTPAP